MYVSKTKKKATIGDVFLDEKNRDMSIFDGSVWRQVFHSSTKTAWLPIDHNNVHQIKINTAWWEVHELGDLYSWIAQSNDRSYDSINLILSLALEEDVSIFKLRWEI